MSSRRSAKKSRRQEIPKKPELASAWMGRTDLHISLAIFLFALSVRVAYLFQIEPVPFFYQLVSDGRSYDEWALRIAAGDWLGQEVFYQAPLYPYFLGILYLVLGRDLWWVRVVQTILGAASCSLLYLAGKAFFSRRVGITAGVILSLYAPAIFFDALIQKTVLDVFFITLLLFFLSRTQERPTWKSWAAIGAALGLLGLSRENALIWFFVLPAWIWFYFGEHPRQMRVRWISVFFAGLMLVLAPVGVRNLMVGGEFTLTTSQFGPNFFIGNNPAADGTYMALRPGHGDQKFERQDAIEIAEQALGRRLSPGEVSGYWLDRSLEFIRSQPMDWARLMGRKWLLLWNVRELEDAEDFYLYQKWSSLLGVLGWASHFGLLAPLAAMGCVLTCRRWRSLWLLYLLLGTLAFSVVLFYVFGRYRFPIVPFLTLFAAAGLTEGVSLYKERMLRQGLICAFVVVVAGIFVYWPIAGAAAPSATGYYNLGNALSKQGRISEAIESYERALQLDPTYSVGYYALGNTLAQQGKLEEATHYLQKAVILDPDLVEAYSNLGQVLFRQGKLENATQQFRKALELRPTSGEIHFNLGNALISQGRTKEAVKYFQEAIKIKPDFVDAYHNLGRVMAFQGQLDTAIELFRRALRIQPNFSAAHQSLAQALAEQGKMDEAKKHQREALRIRESQPESRLPR